MRTFVGLDVDPMAHKMADVQLQLLVNDDVDSSSSAKVFTFVKNFRYLSSVLMEVEEELVSQGVDGILMDLGMSSMQVNDAKRGFSILSDGPLDMRMDASASLRAEDILNDWPEAELGQILRDYGEESNWSRLSAKIVQARTKRRLESTEQLADLIRSACPPTGGRRGWIKTATRVFQALRIAVNDELGTLQNALCSAFDCLSHGGRLAVISFHSLEDRIVKQTFLDIINKQEGDLPARSADNEEEWSRQSVEGRCGTILTKRPITPSLEEEKLNSRCRGAKLRVLEKASKGLDIFHA